jgi:hypothetical protein
MVLRCHPWGSWGEPPASVGADGATTGEAAVVLDAGPAGGAALLAFLACCALSAMPLKVPVVGMAVNEDRAFGCAANAGAADDCRSVCASSRPGCIGCCRMCTSRCLWVLLCLALPGAAATA